MVPSVFKELFSIFSTYADETINVVWGGDIVLSSVMSILQDSRGVLTDTK